MMTRMPGREITKKIYCYSAAYLFFAFFSLPVIWMISTAFKDQLQIFADPPKLLIQPTFVNFKAVLMDRQFVRSFINSFIVGICTVIVTLLLAIPPSYGLTRLTGRMRSGMLSWTLIVRAAPGMIYIIPYFYFFNRIGIMDTKLSLIIINSVFTVPLVIWLLIPFFESIPESLEESARIDGAGRLRILTRICIPIIGSGIASCGILTFIFSWNEFLFALVLSRREARTAPIAIVNYMAYEGTEWGKIAAAGIFILLPVLVFSIAIRKYLVKSAAGSGIKE